MSHIFQHRYEAKKDVDEVIFLDPLSELKWLVQHPQQNLEGLREICGHDGQRKITFAETYRVELPALDETTACQLYQYLSVNFWGEAPDTSTADDIVQLEDTKSSAWALLATVLEKIFRVERESQGNLVNPGFEAPSASVEEGLRNKVEAVLKNHRDTLRHGFSLLREQKVEIDTLILQAKDLNIPLRERLRLTFGYVSTLPKLG